MKISWHQFMRKPCHLMLRLLWLLGHHNLDNTLFLDQCSMQVAKLSTIMELIQKMSLLLSFVSCLVRSNLDHLVLLAQIWVKLEELLRESLRLLIIQPPSVQLLLMRRKNLRIKRKFWTSRKSKEKLSSEMSGLDTQQGKRTLSSKDWASLSTQMNK